MSAFRIKATDIRLHVLTDSVDTGPSALSTSAVEDRKAPFYLQYLNNIMPAI